MKSAQIRCAKQVSGSLSGVASLISGILTGVSNILSTLVGSLGSLLGGAPGGAALPSSSANDRAQIVDTIFGAVA